MSANEWDFPKRILLKNQDDEIKSAFLRWAQVLSPSFFQKSNCPYGNTSTDMDYYIKLCSYGREIHLLRIMCTMSEDNIAECMHKYLTDSNGINEQQRVAFRLWASAHQPY